MLNVTAFLLLCHTRMLWPLQQYLAMSSIQGNQRNKVHCPVLAATLPCLSDSEGTCCICQVPIQKSKLLKLSEVLESNTPSSCLIPKAIFQPSQQPISIKRASSIIQWFEYPFSWQEVFPHLFSEEGRETRWMAQAICTAGLHATAPSWRSLKVLLSCPHTFLKWKFPHFGFGFRE